MCLTVFVEGDKNEYKRLEPFAKSLGAAFQKINFLRDIQADFLVLNRMYFPGVDFNNFTLEDKSTIENDIAYDFEQALIGIKTLSISSKLTVCMADRY